MTGRRTLQCGRAHVSAETFVGRIADLLPSMWPRSRERGNRRISMARVANFNVAALT